MRENSLRHQRAGIEAYRTGGDDIAPAQGEQIGSAWSGADEVHRHSPSPSAIAAVAVRSWEMIREETRRARAPAAASAAASATEPAPNRAWTNWDCVGVSMPARTA